MTDCDLNKIFIIIVILILIFQFVKCSNKENFMSGKCSSSVNLSDCKKFDRQASYQPEYVLELPGAIINPLNSKYYVSIEDTVLNDGNYHIRMYGKTNHDIVNEVEGKYVLKEIFPKYRKCCNFHCCVVELIYIKDTCGNWYVFNVEGELRNVTNSNQILYLNFVLKQQLNKPYVPKN